MGPEKKGIGENHLGFPLHVYSSLLLLWRAVVVVAWGVPSVQSRCQRSGVGAVGWGTHFGRGPHYPFAMPFLSGHHIDAVSTALAILVVLVDSET